MANGRRNRRFEVYCYTHNASAEPLIDNDDNAPPGDLFGCAPCALYTRVSPELKEQLCNLDDIEAQLENLPFRPLLLPGFDKFGAERLDAFQIVYRFIQE